MAAPLITLDRFAYTPMGTFGQLFVGERSFFFVELPWRQNQQDVSCIPEGLYTLRKRQSPVVQRSTGGEFTEGWEVCNVVGRQYIMIHPGNSEQDLLGCLAPGLSLGYVHNRWAVTQSRAAFRRLMEALNGHTEWHLHITRFTPTMQEDYPHA